MNVMNKSRPIHKDKSKNLYSLKKQEKNLRKAPKRLSIVYRKRANNQTMYKLKNIKNY